MGKHIPNAWDDFDDETVVEDYKEGVDAKITAEKIGRSVYAVKTRRRRLLKVGDDGFTYYEKKMLNIE